MVGFERVISGERISAVFVFCRRVVMHFSAIELKSDTIILLDVGRPFQPPLIISQVHLITLFDADTLLFELLDKLALLLHMVPTEDDLVGDEVVFLELLFEFGKG